MDDRAIAAIIAGLVGAIFGGATATIGGIWPLRNELNEYGKAMARMEQQLEAFEKDLAEARGDVRRKWNAVMIALGRRHEIEEE